jgi:hypothetical protein
LLTKDEARRIEYREAAGVDAKGLIGVRQLARGQINRVFKLIPANFAGLYVPHTIIGEMLEPFRCDDIRTAVRTLIE